MSTLEKLPELSTVVKAYRSRKGLAEKCMCGCSGTWRYGKGKTGDRDVSENPTFVKKVYDFIAQQDKKELINGISNQFASYVGFIDMTDGVRTAYFIYFT